VKVCSVTQQFRVSFIVADNFGVDLTSAKENKNTELKENLRSLSRMQESESEVPEDEASSADQQ
jgi:hypothetical protein